MSKHSGTTALGHIRVVAIADDSGAYTAKVLAELGADVLRLLPNDVLRPGMHIDPDDSTRRFLDRSQSLEQLPDGAGAAHDRLVALLTGTDVLIEAGPAGLLARLGVDPDQSLRARPDLIWVRITPFGITGPTAGHAASDLVCSAIGGFLALGGWPDRAPTRAWGDQSWRMASLHAAAGTMLALLERESSGRGQLVDIAVIEAVATALENSLQFLALEGSVRTRVGPSYDEAGTGVFACADGYVYVMVGRLSTRRGWANLITWFAESGAPGAEELLHPEWSDQSFRNSSEAQQSFRRVFEAFAADRSKSQLYVEAQQRAIAITPVNSPADVVASEQLEARDFFRDLDGARSVGAPYRLSVTPWAVVPAASDGRP